MYKFATTLAAVLALCGCAFARDKAPEPALFVVRDADSTLYLYGAIHLRRADDAWGSPAVEAALAQSDEIWTEVEISPQADASAEQLARQLGLAPPERPLSSWLTEAERARLSATAQRLGIDARALEPMQPWLAALTLTVAPMLRAGYDPGAGVDRAIDAYGDSHNKRMRAFETAEQQLGFFANLPDEAQRQVLLEAIDEAEKGVAELDAMSAAWSHGDAEALERGLNQDMRNEYPEVYAAMIVERNDAWVATLLRELQGSGVDFVAVGAAHIVGEDGLVAQLRARGFNVERVRSR